MLVFLRHSFYLNVAFLYADPSASWAIDPSQYRSSAEWLELFISRASLGGAVTRISFGNRSAVVCARSARKTWRRLHKVKFRILRACE